MPRYKLKQAHFLGAQHFLAGAIVDWNGPPSRFMEPLDDAARDAMAVLQQKRARTGRVARPASSSFNRVGLASAIHSSSPPGDKPLWPGAHVVPEDERNKPPLAPIPEDH
jgi:hypothetical protein